MILVYQSNVSVLDMESLEVNLNTVKVEIKESKVTCDGFHAAETVNIKKKKFSSKEYTGRLMLVIPYAAEC